MYLGVIVELGRLRTSSSPHPIHPYTEALLSAIPAIEARADGVAPRSGSCSRARCRARSTRRAAAASTRAARYATEICRVERPQLNRHGNGRFAACHHPLDAKGSAR